MSMLKSLQQDLVRQGLINIPWSEPNLMNFVSSVFRHSKVSYSVLLTALLYLLRFRHLFLVRPACNVPTMQSPTCTALPMIFVSSLLLSTKFLHDRHPSNATWAAMTGIPTIEINRGELFFLGVIGHQLNVDQAAFNKWTGIMFNPKHLAPYQIPAPDNQVPLHVHHQGAMKRHGWEAAGIYQYQYKSQPKMYDTRPYIDPYKRPPEQVFMGYTQLG